MIKQVTILFDDKHSKMVRDMCGEYQKLTDLVSEIVSVEYKKRKGDAS